MHADVKVLTHEDPARGHRRERGEVGGLHAEGGDHAAVIRRIRVPLDVHVGPSGLADQLRRDRLGRTLDEHPIDPIVDLVGHRLQGAGRRPGEAGHGDGIGVDLAVRVAEARVGESRRDRPRDRIPHLLTDGVDRGGPVEVRGRVEVAGEEHGHAVVGKAGEHVELLLDRREARGALQLEHRSSRFAVPHPVRAVRIRREVHVRDRDEPSRRHLGEHVGAVRAGRIDEREARDQLEPRLAVPRE